MPSFFEYDTSFLNIYYAIDIAVENYLKNLIFPREHDLSRIEYASNEYTFRQRTGNCGGVLNLPYINYHVKSGGITYNNDFIWRNSSAYQTGIFFDALKRNIKLMPVQVDFECTFWCTRDDEAKYVANKIVHDLGSTRNPLTYSLFMDNVEIPLFNRLVFDVCDIDSQFTERDWLEKNKLHSVALDFHVMGFALDTTMGIYPDDPNAPCLPEKVIYEFTNSHGINEAYTDDERYTFIIDRFNETIIPEV